MPPINFYARRRRGAAHTLAFRETTQVGKLEKPPSFEENASRRRLVEHLPSYSLHLQPHNLHCPFFPNTHPTGNGYMALLFTLVLIIRYSWPRGHEQIWTRDKAEWFDDGNFMKTGNSEYQRSRWPRRGRIASRRRLRNTSHFALQPEEAHSVLPFPNLCLHRDLRYCEYQALNVVVAILFLVTSASHPC